MLFEGIGNEEEPVHLLPPNQRLKLTSAAGGRIALARPSLSYVASARSSLRRPACRSQLKRDPLGGYQRNARVLALDLIDLPPPKLHEVVVALHDVLELLHGFAGLPLPLHHLLEGLHTRDFEFL